MRIDDSTLTSIVANEEAFDRFFRAYVSTESWDLARLFPKFAPMRIIDAYHLWRKDLERLKHSLPQNSKVPDHFKHAAHLAYWIRRSAPIVDFNDVEHFKNDAVATNPHVKRACDYFYKYPNEYFAFDIGFQICRYYERQAAIESAGGNQVGDFGVDDEFLSTMLYFLKEKNVSPHALFLIFKGLFHARF